MTGHDGRHGRGYRRDRCAHAAGRYARAREEAAEGHEGGSYGLERAEKGSHYDKHGADGREERGDAQDSVLGGGV